MKNTDTARISFVWSVAWASQCVCMTHDDTRWYDIMQNDTRWSATHRPIGSLLCDRSLELRNVLVWLKMIADDTIWLKLTHDDPQCIGQSKFVCAIGCLNFILCHLVARSCVTSSMPDSVIVRRVWIEASLNVSWWLSWSRNSMTNRLQDLSFFVLTSRSSKSLWRRVGRRSTRNGVKDSPDWSGLCNWGGPAGNHSRPENCLLTQLPEVWAIQTNTNRTRTTTKHNQPQQLVPTPQHKSRN